MISFVQQTIRDFRSTGAVWPSSARLGAELCAPLARAAAAGAGPLRVLEAGAGTGAVTGPILRTLRPEDRLVISELNPAFVRHLRDRLETEPLWREKAHLVEIVEGPVQQLAQPHHGGGARDGFDFIICGLPFTNFPPRLVAEIFQGFQSMARPGAILTWFEYLALRRLRMSLGPWEYRRLKAVARAIEAHRKTSPGAAGKRLVVSNIPPAWVHCVQLTGPIQLAD